jgi:hypothetical protein
MHNDRHCAPRGAVIGGKFSMTFSLVGGQVHASVRHRPTTQCAFTRLAATSASATSFSSVSRGKYLPLMMTALMRRMLLMFSSGLASSQTRSASLSRSTVPSFVYFEAKFSIVPKL